MAPKDKKKKKEKDMDELKRELEMDQHRVAIEELYKRYGSDPNKVYNISLRHNNRGSYRK